jgi:phage gpG-like protein
MRVSLTVTGADLVARDLAAAGARLEQPPGALLSILGEEMASTFQGIIRDEGARVPGGWPALHPVTIKIRQHYGHGAGPRLIRGGQLLHSIRVLSVTESAVEAGTTDPRAAVLQAGGPWTDPETGAQRQVQAFPFVVLLEEDVDDWMEMIAAWFFGDGGIARA